MSGYCDSNTGPSGPKPDALANCATPRFPLIGLQRFADFSNAQNFMKLFLKCLYLAAKLTDNDRSPRNRKIFRHAESSQGDRLPCSKSRSRVHHGSVRGRKIHTSPDTRHTVEAGCRDVDHRRNRRIPAEQQQAFRFQEQENRLCFPVPPPSSGVHLHRKCDDARSDCRETGKRGEDGSTTAP